MWMMWCLTRSSVQGRQGSLPKNMDATMLALTSRPSIAGLPKNASQVPPAWMNPSKNKTETPKKAAPKKETKPKAEAAPKKAPAKKAPAKKED